MIEYAHLQSFDNGQTWNVVSLYTTAKEAERAVDDAIHWLCEKKKKGYQARTVAEAHKAIEAIEKNELISHMVGWRRVTPGWNEYNSWDPPSDEGIITE